MVSPRLPQPDPISGPCSRLVVRAKIAQMEQMEEVFRLEKLQDCKVTRCTHLHIGPLVQHFEKLSFFWNFCTVFHKFFQLDKKYNLPFLPAALLSDISLYAIFRADCAKWQTHPDKRFAIIFTPPDFPARHFTH